jgi:acetoin utilization deacetylase AcuC-like enzyme
MEVLLVSHPSALAHDAGRGHPERPARIEAALAGARGSGLPITELAAERIDPATLELVHDADYIEMVEQFCLSGGGAFDPDTRVVAESWEAALHSAGGGLTALDALADRPDAAAFVAMRPPGHHALRAAAMGFCLFNNIAVAAKKLVEEGRRVAIVDWDVHHGNGTQRMFYDDPNVLYVSLHQSPFYPGTGWETEVGEGAGEGTVVNLAWPAGTSGATYHDAMERVVLPILEGFAPDDLLVSAGYDAHRRDPLADMRLEDDDYRLMAAAVRHRLGTIRTVFFLEGGYDLEAIAGSVAETLRGTAGGSPSAGPHDVPPHNALITEALRRRLSRWYEPLR